MRLSYSISADGKPVGEVADDAFVVGAGEAIPGLEQGVRGLKPGDKKTIAAGPRKAFGDYDPAKKKTLPKSLFSGMGPLKPGMTVSGALEGAAASGTVLAVSSSSVTLDFNHPLAGKTIVWDVQVLDVSPASAAQPQSQP